jgi:hypothetical protein
MDSLRWRGYRARREHGQADLSCAVEFISNEIGIERQPEAYHLCLDKRFEGVDLLVTLPLNKFDFTKGTFADDLQCAVVLRAFGSSEETEEVCFLLLGGVLLLFFASIG